MQLGRMAPVVCAREELIAPSVFCVGARLGSRKL